MRASTSCPAKRKIVADDPTAEAYVSSSAEFGDGILVTGENVRRDTQNRFARSIPWLQPFLVSRSLRSVMRPSR